MKKLVDLESLKKFKVYYEKASSLKLPMAYLIKSDAYGFFTEREMIGGFILGSGGTLRTIEVFVAQENKDWIYRDLIDISQYCEVCCFWVDRKYRKKKWLIAKLWLQMAYKVKLQNKPFILYGTNSKGLAYMYGYPKNSLLFHQDLVNNAGTYVFIARRQDFAAGVWEIVFSKFFKKRPKVFTEKRLLKNKIFLELALLKGIPVEA